MKEEIEHIKRWAAQDHTGLSARNVADAVMRMCDDVLATPPPQVVRGELPALDTEGEYAEMFRLHILTRWSYEQIKPFCLHLLGDVYQEQSFNSEKLAGLVNTYIAPGGLRTTTPPQAVEEIRRLAALLAPKAPTP